MTPSPADLWNIYTTSPSRVRIIFLFIDGLTCAAYSAARPHYSLLSAWLFHLLPLTTTTMTTSTETEKRRSAHVAPDRLAQWIYLVSDREDLLHIYHPSHHRLDLIPIYFIYNMTSYRCDSVATAVLQCSIHATTVIRGGYRIIL